MRTRLIGRERELAAIASALASGVRVVTLHGPPGVGKTRVLHGAVAQVVSLADSFLPAIARALNVASTRDPLTAIAEALEDRTVTLGLDAFERCDARELDALIDAAPGLSLVIASRERTRIAGEVIVPIDPLPLADAVALFEERARAVAPQRVLGDVRALVERLDRLPLAIELAAARTPLLSVSELLARIDGPLGAAIEASLALLSDEERRAFAACSVFRGGFTLDAAEVVLGPSAPALLDRLVSHALVIANDDGDGTRFDLLHTLRDEAARRLEDKDVMQRHARYYAGTRDARRERENLLAALDYAEPADVVRIAVALDPVLVAEGPYELHRAVLDRALAADMPSPSLLRAEGRYRALRGSHRAAVELHRRARELSHGDRHGEAWADGMLAFSLFALGDEKATAHANSMLKAAQELGDRQIEVFAEMTLGLCTNDVARLHNAAALARRLGATRMAALALANAGAIARKHKQLDEARAAIDESRTLLAGVGDRLHLAKVAAIEAGVLRDVGQLDDAEARLTRAIADLALFDDPAGELAARLELAAVARDRGDVRLARRALEDARALLPRVDDAELHARADAFDLDVAPRARTLRVAKDGRTANFGDRAIELTRRGVTRRVLLSLVRQRLNAPGIALTVHQVFEAGWPGERAVGTSGNARVYMTIRALRALGLEGALLTRDDGYLLDPQLDVSEF